MNDRKYIDATEWVTKYAVEIKMVDTVVDFNKVTETLTRIGIANYHNKVLTQSCHLLFQDKKYYIVHFKELLALAGNAVNIEGEDILRRNKIISLLTKWNMIRVCEPKRIENRSLPTAFTVISFQDKDKWNLKAKFKQSHEVEEEI